MPIQIRTTTGFTDLYALFKDTVIAVALTEEASLDAGWYTASDAAIDAAGLSAGTYAGAILHGTVGSPSASDPEEGTFARFEWDGTNEVDPLAYLDAPVSEAGGGGGAAAQVDNSDIVASRVFKLGSRVDGVVNVNGTCRLKVGDKYPAWIDTKKYGGRWLDNVSDAASSAAGLTLVSAGMNQEYVVLWLQAVTVGSYTVIAKAHPRSADTIICKLTVEVLAA